MLLTCLSTRIGGVLPFWKGASVMATASEAPSHYDQNNVFARILRNEIPSFRIFETDEVLAILDAFPVTPGHSLLIPKEPVRDFASMTPEGAAKTLKYVPALVKIVKDATGATGANVVANCGEDAGQVVFHAHLHIIPRFPNDGMLKFPSNAPLVGGAEMLAKLRAHLPDNLISS